MKVLITGYKGFIGLNLATWLKESGHEVLGIDKDNIEKLDEYIINADFLVHLAAANRPLNNQEFYDNNVNFTKVVSDKVLKLNKNIPIIFSSSIKAEIDSDYGKSKRMAEEYLMSLNLNTYIFRLSNVFGKWCKPNYNSVVATYCYNISRNIGVYMSDPKNVVKLVYIDDVCKTWLDLIEGRKKLKKNTINFIEPIYTTTLQKLKDLIVSFKNTRENLFVPDSSDEYKKKMYATYISYIDCNNLSYLLKTHNDDRGSFTEIIKGSNESQISVNVIKPGITKGNHYHNLKTEKYITLKGTTIVRLRRIIDDEIIEYKTSGNKFEVIDIPVGYTHSISNISNDESIVLMWVNECFDKDNPDTYIMDVIKK